MVDEHILSDERMAVSATVLLANTPTPTKVRIVFEFGVWFGQVEIESKVNVRAEAVYGERLNESKMSEFLSALVGSHLGGADGWSEVVAGFKQRLLMRGKKD